MYERAEMITSWDLEAYAGRWWGWCLFVCNLVFITRYMRPEGLW